MTTIRVVLVEAGSGDLLGQSDVPVEQLPENFALETTLHIGDEEFSVERAEPLTRAQFVESGQLQLWLRTIERIDPMAIHFLLPTLENTAPALGSRCSETLVMHEDDWRQRELVSARFLPEIEAELQEIRTIYAEQSVGVGFRTLHLRQRIPEPLAGVALTVDGLGLAGPRWPLSLGTFGQREGNVVLGGFAFGLGEGFVYGREDAGQLLALGLSSGAAPAPLAALAAAHELVFVDWCPARCLRSDGERFL